MKRKTILFVASTVIASFALAAGLVVGAANQQKGLVVNAMSGNGTSEDPYLISTTSELEEVISNVDDGSNDYKGKYLKLTNDISITIGSTTNAKTFRGHLDGDGHTITLSTEATGTMVAMFNYVGGVATVSNITFEGSLTTPSNYIGTVCIYNNGTISNITNNCVLGSTSGSVTCVGGVASVTKASSSNINNCVNNADIYAQKYAGGIVGNQQYGTINGCINNGSITTSSTAAGGIVGLIGMSTAKANVSINGCINNGAVSGTGQVGGIAGGVFPCLTISSCDNYGNITASGNAGVGGLVGLVNSASTSIYSDSDEVLTINNSYGAGIITTHAGWAGGLFGYANGDSIGILTFNNVVSAARVVCTSNNTGLGGFMAGQNSSKATFKLNKCITMASVSLSGTANYSIGIGLNPTNVVEDTDSNLAKCDLSKGVELSATTLAMIKAVREFNCSYDSDMLTTITAGLNTLTSDEEIVLASATYYDAHDVNNSYYDSAVYAKAYLTYLQNNLGGVIGFFSNNNNHAGIIVLIVVSTLLITSIGVIVLKKKKEIK